MKVLIVGSTGMLGQALVKEAVTRNVSAVGLARRGAELSCDVADATILATVLDAVRPQVIVNAAALTELLECERNPEAAYLVNARCVAVLAEYAQKSRSYLIQVSTDHYYTGDGASLHSEDAPVRLLNEYARTKYAGEHFALTAPNSLVIRTNIVGFRGTTDKPTFVEWVLGALKRREALTLFDDFFTSSIDVMTFSSAVFDLLQLRPVGILNMASGDVVSKKTFIEVFAERFDFCLEGDRVASVKMLGGVCRAESLGLDVSRAEALLGYRLPCLPEVISHLADAYQEQANAI